MSYIKTGFELQWSILHPSLWGRVKCPIIWPQSMTLVVPLDDVNDRYSSSCISLNRCTGIYTQTNPLGPQNNQTINQTLTSWFGYTKQPNNQPNMKKVGTNFKKIKIAKKSCFLIKNHFSAIIVYIYETRVSSWFGTLRHYRRLNVINRKNAE
jgi:hypothetical protein